MKQTMRRPVAWLLSLVMVASLFFGIPMQAEAATVNYVYDGKYVYNWGVRETDATYLSPMAEAFYAKNGFSYKDVAALAGSSDTSSVPSSALYQKLQSLMKSNHTHKTSYGETRDQYKYTDCQNSAVDSTAISSFYSGKAIGPTWDSGKTWNREHTWPNSKGLGGSDEDDIMMLRPTWVSENSSRGNTAYGDSAGYFKPNIASNGTYDVRGDVARIVLYTYVRWGNTSYMWGSSGVIESKEVLIKWMTEDPVDTWELGRNDSVEAITGTRNVFVDYPELAFELFEETVPSNYTSPSGAAKTYGTVANATTGNGNTGDSSTGGTTTGNNTNTNTNANNNQNTTTNQNSNANQNSNVNQNQGNSQEEPVVNTTTEDTSTEDTASNEADTQSTETSSDVDETKETEDEADSQEEQAEEESGFPMEAIFVVMLIVGIAGLAALLISDRKEKEKGSSEEKE